MTAIEVVQPVELQTEREGQIGQGVDLGVFLGRRQAFALIAGRCSTADAVCIREVRRSKGYRILRMTWVEFCAKRLGISRVTADKIVRQLEEFGPEFFTLAQLTHVTAEEYRRLGLATRGNALLHAGEEIPIEAENGARLSAAIQELRNDARALPADAPVEVAVEVAAEVPAVCAPGPQAPADTRTGAERSLALADEHLRASIQEFEDLQSTLREASDLQQLRLMAYLGYLKLDALRR